MKIVLEFIFGFEPLQPYLVTAETILYEHSALKKHSILGGGSAGIKLFITVVRIQTKLVLGTLLSVNMFSFSLLSKLC